MEKSRVERFKNYREGTSEEQNPPKTQIDNNLETDENVKSTLSMTPEEEKKINKINAKKKACIISFCFLAGLVVIGIIVVGVLVFWS